MTDAMQVDNQGSLFPAVEPVYLPDGPPILCIIVDAEEEFHWGHPVSSRNNGTASIRHQRRAQDIFAHYDAKPTYLVTYPVASDPAAASVLRDYLTSGCCDIGAQLHPWVTPPFASAKDEQLTFPGNLDPVLEREKLLHLTDAVHETFGIQPTVYKAGRYGLGPASARLLEDAGYLVDTSLIPRTSYVSAGGPDFAGFDYGPFWFGRERRLLELPVTRALTGGLSARWPGIYPATYRQPWRQLQIRGALARTRLLERITLSPEGSDLDAMLRLTRTLLARGERILTLSYHSPSLQPGNTPYVQTQSELAVFLDRLSGYLDFFCNTLGGSVLTVRELHDQLRHGTLQSDTPGRRSPVPIAGDRRCLVVANTFPPVHGGSAIVYDSLARFGGGRVSVLAPQYDYRDGLPIAGWREFDRRAPFRVYRIRRLRTLLRESRSGLAHRILGVLDDMMIRLAALRAIRRIVRDERIAVLCIGELVAGGWLARVAPLLGLRSLIYVHGEEITTRSSYDANGSRRRGALARADGVIAVSRFTRDTLINVFGVEPQRIQLVSNGVDLHRFMPGPRAAHLIDRYNLRGKRVLLTISRLYPRKGIDRVIEALPEVVRHIPDLVYLVVGGGSFRPALESLVTLHGVGEHVVFAGAVPDYELAEHYSLGDVFIMANREMPDGETEGFGLVFLEANACGLPVIAGRAGGSVDAVTDEINGLVIDGEDTNAIATAILRVFRDDALRESLREGGARIAHGAAWNRKVEQFLGVCDQLTRSGDRGRLQ